MLDEGEAGENQRGQAVTHHVDVQALEVGNIASNVETEARPMIEGRVAWIGW
jgi:hypothetical protein